MSQPASPRLTSLDAYRGFIMLVMASGGFGFHRIHMQLESSLAATAAGMATGPSGPLGPAVERLAADTSLHTLRSVWAFLGYQFEHVPWVGCSFWDLIQPSFMFMVGVALPYSLASRLARGDSYATMLRHAVRRALILILLAVFLSSPQTDAAVRSYLGPTTNWVFPNVLAQIGLGYVFVCLLVGRGLSVQLAAAAAILTGYTLFFGLFPAPESSFRWQAVGVPNDWPHLEGWFSHWDKNSNAAHYFDVWLLNLFPRVEPFVYNSGGYQTLNFVPSMATMILGVIAGERLRSAGSAAGKLAWLVAVGVLCLAAGWVMGETVCPIVKRIWTPSWAVFSAGWTFLMLAAFYGVIDVAGLRRWSFPLVVVGMNSIAMYCMAQLLKPWVRRSLGMLFGRGWISGDYNPDVEAPPPLTPGSTLAHVVHDYAPVAESVAILIVLWLFCYWLYKRGIFLRI